jgi:hypothetical protein
MSDLTRAYIELSEACEQYDTAEMYYNGTNEERLAGRLMSRMFSDSNYRFSINFARRPVDARLDRLEITAITAGDNTELLNEEVWVKNQLDVEAPDVIKYALVYGDAYLFVGADGDGGVELYYNSPKTVRVFYDEDNPRTKSYAIKSWMIWDEENNRELSRVNLYYADRIEKYSIRPRTTTQGLKDADFDSWVDEVTDENGVADNPLGEVPFFHFRTGRTYGHPEHEAAFGAQDALTKLVINQMTSSDFSVYPQRWAIEDPTGDTMDDIDFGDEDETSSPSSSLPQSQLQSGPGTLQLFKNLKTVGEFSAAQAANFLEPMNWYVRAMSAETATPLHYFDPVGDAPSGESLRALEAPLIKRVRSLQVLLGATWKEALRFALKVLGSDNNTVAVQWSNPQVIDDLQGWQAVNEKIKSGVPRKQALMEAGYSEQEVLAWGVSAISEPDGSNSTGEGTVG